MKIKKNLICCILVVVMCTSCVAQQGVGLAPSTESTLPRPSPSTQQPEQEGELPPPVTYFFDGYDYSYSLEMAVELELPAEASLLCYSGQQLIYSVEDVATGNQENPYVFLYQYDLEQKNVVQLGRVRLPNPTSTHNVVILDGDVFCLTQEENALVLRRFSAHGGDEAVSQWNDEIYFSYLYTLGDDIIFFCTAPAPEQSENLRSLVELINPATGQRSVVVERVYEKGASDSQGISCIDVADECIYAYTYSAQYDSNTLEVYTPAGERKEVLPLDIGAFLTMDWPPFQDTVFSIAVHGDYLFLNTINSRVCILQLDEGILTPLGGLPAQLYDSRPTCSYHVLSYPNDAEVEKVLIESIRTQPNFYVFDCTSGSFTTLSLQLSAQNLYSYICNEVGDIVIQSRPIEAGGTICSSYFLSQTMLELIY